MCEHIEDIVDVSQSGIMQFWLKDTQSQNTNLPALATLYRVRHGSSDRSDKGL